MALVRVYHPETNEPFDVPEHVATRLRLIEGWLSHEFELAENVVKAEVIKVEAEVIKLEAAAKAEAEAIIQDVQKIIKPTA